MLSSLSDRGKLAVVFSAVFFVALANLLFERNWAATPPGPLVLRPAATMRTMFAPTIVPTAVPNNDGAQADNFAAPTSGQAVKPAEPAPKCDIEACTAAYFSFRAADCTYQPNGGGRRLCTKGNPNRPPQ